MKRNTEKFISLRNLIGKIIVVLFCLWLVPDAQVVYGASASVTISTEKSEVIAGETFSVIVTAESSAVISDFEAYISYDPLILEFTSGGKLVSGGNGLIFISDIANGNNTVKKYVLEFKAIKSGSSEVAIAEKPMVYGDGNREEMSVSKNSLTIGVSGKPSKKNINDLKELSLVDEKISPSFSKDVTEYAATVKNSVTHIAVKAVAEDVDAKIQVTGNDSLEEGNNEIRILVTAEDGSKKEYKITAYRKTKQEEAYEKEEKQQKKDEDTKQEEGQIDGFLVYKKDGEVLFENSYQYTILDVPEDAEIPVGYKKTSITLCSVNLPAYELKVNSSEKDFFILYARNEEGEEGFYRYDRKEKTLQRYVGSLTASTDLHETETENQGMEETDYRQKVNQMMIITFVMIGISVVFLLIIIKLFLTMRMKRPTEEEK